MRDAKAVKDKSGNKNKIDNIIEITMTKAITNPFSSSPTGVRYLISLFIDSIY